MKLSGKKKFLRTWIVAVICTFVFSTTAQAREDIPSRFRQFSDYSKVNKLISCFDIPVGFIVNPAMEKEKKLEKLTNNFMVAASAWNVEERYWENFVNQPYGIYSIDNKYVMRQSKILFNKSCSYRKYPKFSFDDKRNKMYLYTSLWKNHIILYGYSSPYTVTHKINQISQLDKNLYKVYVTYYAKNAYTNQVNKTMKMVYTLRRKQTLRYGYYVSNINMNMSKEPVHISKAAVTPLKSYKYRGKAIKPLPKVIYKNKTLVRNRDYTLFYQNNSKPGTAKVIIKGRGKFEGTRVVYFKISKAK